MVYKKRCPAGCNKGERSRKNKTGGEGAWPVNIIKVRNMPLIFYFVICFVILRLFVLKYEEKIATFTRKQMEMGKLNPG